MKAPFIIFPRPGQVEVREEQVAEPSAGEVLCVAVKSLISTGTETFCLRGEFDPGTNWADWVKFPFRPGYSMVGRVVAVGEGVSNLHEGDRVFYWSVHRGAFRARSEELIPIPDGVSDEEATWTAIAVITQLGVRRAQHALGERVGVVGLGMLGQLVVQYLALSGMRQIVAIDLSQKRLEMARAHGATHTLCMGVEEALPHVEEITQGHMFDVVYDVTGHYAVLAHCVRLANVLGRVILLGDCPTPSRQCLGPGVVSNSLAILGAHSTLAPEEPSPFNRWSRKEMINLFFDFVRQGRMRVADLITHRYPAREAPQAYAMLTGDRSAAVGVIFEWE